tara:strand:+ start:89 stop:436 length:348 start_codon:yes stop_codon:yes gene_type:complete
MEVLNEVTFTKGFEMENFNKFEGDVEFNLQPPVEQVEEWHDEDSLGELETNEFDSIEIDIEDSRDMYDEISDNELYEDDGQPDEYTEWQDFMGGDDWDHGQYDSMEDYFDGGTDY